VSFVYVDSSFLTDGCRLEIIHWHPVWVCGNAAVYIHTSVFSVISARFIEKCELLQCD